VEQPDDECPESFCDNTIEGISARARIGQPLGARNLFLTAKSGESAMG
jgi:hypothetical protein